LARGLPSLTIRMATLPPPHPAMRPLDAGASPRCYPALTPFGNGSFRHSENGRDPVCEPDVEQDALHPLARHSTWLETEVFGAERVPHRDTETNPENLDSARRPFDADTLSPRTDNGRVPELG